MSTYDRIMEFCKAKGIAVTALEKELGFSRGSIGKMKDAKRSPSIDRLQKIADYFDVPLSDLRSEPKKKNIIRVYHSQESMGNKRRGSEWTNIVDVFAGDAGLRINKRIPVLGRVAAGLPMSAQEEILDWEEITGDMALDGDYFALQIKGDSMEPRMKDGDVVIVRQQEDADDGDVVIALIDGNDAVCKRLKKYEDGIALVSTNPAYEPMYFSKSEIDMEPVRIIGRVKELRAKY